MVRENAGNVYVADTQTLDKLTETSAENAGKGDAQKNNGVILNLDTEKEIVEDLSPKDVKFYGIPDLIGKRKNAFVKALAVFLDKVFFAKAVEEGTEVALSGYSSIEEKVEAMILAVETVENSNVEGVDRSDIVVSLKPASYAKFISKCDTLANPYNGGVNGKFYHDVEIVSNVRQTKDVVSMARGSVALQTAMLTDTGIEVRNPVYNPKKALVMFFMYGVKVIMPDLVFYGDIEEVEPSA